MSYLPLSEKDREEMLTAIGVDSFDDLISVVPRSLRDPDIELPAALSEIELVRAMKDLAAQNDTTQTSLSFVGGGAYEHFIPSVVDHVVSRSEFYTACTPYQAEASQGTLQSIYEYQSMMCQLTGMAVSNASHYDGATSMAEAAIVSATVKRRSKILVAENVSPDYRSVLDTYMAGSSMMVETIPFAKDGFIDRAVLSQKLETDVACVIVQTPNVFGLVEDFADVEELIHAANAHFIVVANPLSLARFKSPGEWHADIACGDGQVFGNRLSFGGPYLGFFATTKALMRKMPGRLVGMTQDTKGRRAFTLTLQTREQHIRREKATSNICSNQALCALAAGVYMAAMGREGLKRIADLNLQNAEYLKKKIAAIEGFSIMFPGQCFNEFVVQTTQSPEKIIATLHKKKMCAGIDLARWFPTMRNALLVCATETKTKNDLDLFVEALKSV